MLFFETPVAGVLRIEIEPRTDERGFFARTRSRSEFERRGLRAEYVECSVSRSSNRGTLRGMHYQAAPRAEAKIVTCIAGAIYDVAVDLRPGSPTFRKWAAVELAADTLGSLYVPEGCAHGFLTLTPDAVVSYQISEVYSPEHARGVRWDDPAFAIAWPFRPVVLSERDAGYADFPVRADG